MNVAKAIDGIPIVQSTTERGILFSTPSIDQRVFNKATGNVERWDGATWAVDFGPGRTTAPELNMKDAPFFAKDDGVTDNIPALTAAFNVLSLAGGGTLVFPKVAVGYFFGSAWPSPPANVKIRGLGWNLTKFIKGFNGDLCTITSTGFEVTGVHVIGQYGTYTGRGFVFSGNASNYPIFLRNFFEGFSDSHIAFGADAGKFAIVAFNQFFATIASGQPDFRAIHCSGTDTTAMKRQFQCNNGNGWYELFGTLDTQIDNCSVTSVRIDNTCSLTYVSNTIMADSGQALNIGGQNTLVSNSRHSGDITIISGSTGSWIGNVLTSGTFTNNATQSSWIVFHHPLAAAHHLLAKHFLPANSSTGHAIVTYAVVSAGDADNTFTPMSSVTVYRYASVLTADRTHTLLTTNVVNGTHCLVTRPTTSTGAFLVNVVGPGALVSLASGQQVLLIYNGTSWVVVGTGYVGTDQVVISGPAATARSAFFRTGNVNRAALALSNAAEGGSNAGSDLQLTVYDDSGASLGIAMTVKRSTQAVSFLRSVSGAHQGPAYSASITIDASQGNVALITATNGTAFTLNAPTNPASGQRLRIRIKNTSGGALGVATWNATFKMGAAWAQPATGFSRSIDFDYDGTNWVEANRSAADVAN